VNRVYVCSCFGITEQQVKQHADEGRRTPRQVASACKAGTDCGSCVKRIQGLLGRGAGCGAVGRAEAASPALLAEVSQVAPASQAPEVPEVTAA
jgi:bacterioferritin-associated ferredoxin